MSLPLWPFCTRWIFTHSGPSKSPVLELHIRTASRPLVGALKKALNQGGTVLDNQLRFSIDRIPEVAATLGVPDEILLILNDFRNTMLSRGKLTPEIIVRRSALADQLQQALALELKKYTPS